MSRSWREQLFISLSPNELAFVRMKGGVRPRITSQHVVPCETGFGSEPWDGAMAVLKDQSDAILDEALDVTVILSNHFVRYALVSWNEALSGTQEQLAFARHSFVKIHGDRAKTWALSLSEESKGAPRVASAIDAELLERIRQCFPSGGKARLVSVQPCLMAAVNLWYRPVSKDGAWLLIAERGRNCLAFHAEGRWQSIINTKGSHASPAEWSELLDRERLRTAIVAPATKVLVCAFTEVALQELPDGGEWQFEPALPPALDGVSPTEDRRYAMALSAGFA